ncbi:ROK family transcriptional regulator [Streptosporangium roseum]|uniref:Transcriptional regulator, ROK family n=1 Tax=Streptosporangium roseum (strain ATCC 12428 / DSM 43021 / JCM 3005 / KCTC 9067 / NCIMB 10171 / NRRL 2505 / NI 9100) TaxID=479432 RepID=D2B9Z8_STRRD|nr:ROK family protein [Streptosporangium roseum]ACZ86011.1 transcriptional regulator, ROK family [Streptosporangium roseum DSM 43021]
MSNDGVLRNLRRQHELRVLAILVERGPCSRRELENATGLSRTTMSAIVADLVRRRAVADDAQRPAPGRGRPTTLVRLNPHAAAAVGVELGRGHVSVAVADIARTVLAHVTEPIGMESGLSVRMDAALSLLKRVAAGRRLALEGLAAAGLGLWGHHPDPRAGGGDPAGDLVVTDLAERLGGTLDVPVTWDNNIRLAAVAERYTVESPACADLVYIALSHGVGSGVVINGTLARGASGTAGEIGHVSVEPSGPPCWCGGRGCLEQYLSIDAVLGRVRAVAPDVADVAGLVAALDRGDRSVRDVVDWSAELLGRALGTVAILLDPHRVVIGGELADLGDHLLDPVRASLARQKLSIRDRRLELGTARISQGAAAVGAALVALDRHSPIHGIGDVTAEFPGKGDGDLCRDY